MTPPEVHYSSLRPNTFRIKQGQSDFKGSFRIVRYHLILSRGLFCLTNDDDAQSMDHRGIAGIRIEALPDHQADVIIGGFRKDGYLRDQNDAVLLRVLRNEAKIFVSILQDKDFPEAPMHLRVQSLHSASMAEKIKTEETSSNLLTRQPIKKDLLIHVKSLGDLGGAFGHWVGVRGSRNWIEGFEINCPQGLMPDDIRYRALLAPNWLTPECKAGEYCGSRGVGFPLTGFTVRLCRKAKRDFSLRYYATFTDSNLVKSAKSGEPCSSATSNGYLEAIMVDFVPKALKPNDLK